MRSTEACNATATSKSLQVGGAWDQACREILNYLHPVLRPICLSKLPNLCISNSYIEQESKEEKKRTTNVCDSVASATPDLLLSSQPQGITAHWLVPNYTAGDRGTCVLTTCPGLHSTAGRPGFEPATCWSQIQHPNHSATEPHTGFGLFKYAKLSDSQLLAQDNYNLHFATLLTSFVVKIATG